MEKRSWKTYVRPVLYVVILLGVAWYVNRHMKQKAARERYQVAVDYMKAKEFAKAIPVLKEAEGMARESGDTEALSVIQQHLDHAKKQTQTQ